MNDRAKTGRDLQLQRWGGRLGQCCADSMRTCDESTRNGMRMAYRAVWPDFSGMWIGSGKQVVSKAELQVEVTTYKRQLVQERAPVT